MEKRRIIKKMIEKIQPTAEGYFEKKKILKITQVP